MAGTFTASVENWSNKAKRNAVLIVRQSIQDTAEMMSERQPSVKVTGGTFEVGKVPVDTGELVNSQLARINGGTVGSGEVSYAAVVSGMELGDVVEAVFTAQNPRPIGYGTSKFAGRFYVREAVQRWQATVAKNADRLRD